MIVLLSFLMASAVTIAGVFILQSMRLMGTADTDMKNLPYVLP